MLADDCAALPFKRLPGKGQRVLRTERLAVSEEEKLRELASVASFPACIMFSVRVLHLCPARLHQTTKAFRNFTASFSFLVALVSPRASQVPLSK